MNLVVLTIQTSQDLRVEVGERGNLAGSSQAMG